MTHGFELVLDAGCALGESPVWLAAEQRLAFVDITGRRVHWFDPKSGDHAIVDVDEDIACIAPALGGGFVAGMRSGIWLLDARAAKRALLAANPEPQGTNRFNDGHVDPKGRYVSGTVDEPKAGAKANLYRYDRRGLARLAADLTTTNGLSFSPDGRVLYFSDTPKFVVWRCDYDPQTGAASNQRIFTEFQPTALDRGRPDGAAVDADGGYWCAVYEGARLHRYDPDGQLIAAYPVPARKVTMPAFGGPDLSTLYVTSARDEKGEGGGLYAADVGVRGLGIPPFDPSAT
jgi:sugar lactone lactonase YvrE